MDKYNKEKQKSRRQSFKQYRQNPYEAQNDMLKAAKGGMPMMKTSDGSASFPADYTFDDLKRDLQTALQLELSTIPPYLCALYSIKEGTNKMATEIIKSVVIEEMLHMVMVANLINSIGGEPIIGKVPGEEFVPTYPTHLPGNVDKHLVINLGSMTPRQIKAFCKIEHPGDEGLGVPKRPDDKDGFRSIGEFYHAIRGSLIHFEEEAQKNGGTIFTGTKQQVTPDHYYGAGGGIIPVHCLEDAMAVIDEIVEQGEGTLGSIFSGDYHEEDNNMELFGPDVEEYAHYFRFKEVLHGRFYQPTDSAHRDSPNKGLPTGEPIDVDWDAVYNMADNPKMADYPKDSEIYQKMYEFNLTYMALLDNLNTACNGNPDALREGIMVMYDLKYKAAELMKIPGKDGYNVGPSFEYIEH